MKVQEIPRAWRAAVLVVAWAAVYLVNVGVSELSFNEGRRVFPAQGMQVTGEWLQPMLAGELYDRKPPLFNWMIAASFRCFGESEMSRACREPSHC